MVYTVLFGNQDEENNSYLLQFDGLAEPNPGKGSAGAVIFSPLREILVERGHYIPHTTNNNAEYMGLLIGVRCAIECGAKNLLIEGDSNLVISQITGKWKVRDDNLKKYHSRILQLLREHFDFVGIRHVLRNNNKHADALTNETVNLGAPFHRCYE